jgi:hypothetical protein
MATPIFHIRFTAEERSRIARIKHLAGYMTDAKAIREALKDKLERLETKKGGE